eukprot:m.296579 g.296579  ORF g.296579 m.296579 type:complete len:310 (+) comp19522_c1_seq13:80-1009(+)
MLSKDQGAAWENVTLSSSAVLGGGTVMLTPTQFLATRSFKRNSLTSFAAPGRLLTLSGTPGIPRFVLTNTTRDITFNGFPQDFANTTEIIRWCLPQTTHSGLTVEVVQTEFVTEAGHPKQRALTLFTSSDNFTWQYKSTIASHSWPQFVHFDNGPCEAAVTELSPGTLFVVFRVDSFASYFAAISLDAGASWSTPKQLPSGVGSVRPRLAVAGSTVLLAGGRPGLMLWHAAEPPLVDWMTNTMHEADPGPWMAVNLALTHNALLPQEPQWHVVRSVVRPLGPRLGRSPWTIRHRRPRVCHVFHCQVRWK